LYKEVSPEDSLNPLILSPKHPSRSSAFKISGNAYKVAAATLVAGVAASLVFAAFPIHIDAFWPFPSTHAASDDLPVLHDASQEYLDPATNPDPNPSKGGLSIATTEDSALVPSGGPVGALSSASIGGTGGSEITLYEVREGDTLSEIADMFGVSVNTILWANDIKDASTIQPGDTLLILPVSGVQYTVKRGGTLEDVAELFDADVEEIALFNGIDPDAPLAAGTELIVPGGNLAPVKKTTAKAASSASKPVASTARQALPDLTGYYRNPLGGSYLSQGIHGTNGVDLAGMPVGSPVTAAAAGTVIVSKSGGGYNGGYGNYVVVTHDNGTQTLYAHLSSVSVTVGQSIAQGETLGGVGNTGRSTGIHLHFEVRGAKNPFSN
jgi:LysM repeat protein